MEEEWRVVIFEDEEVPYMISNHGNFYSIESNKLITPRVDKHGYLLVRIYVYGEEHTCLVHRLVAEAFIPNPENKPEVNHKDGDKSNNYDWNLEWVTSKENKEHAKKHGLTKFLYGEDKPNTNYTNAQVKETCKLLERNELNYHEISEVTGVSVHDIYSICSKVAWTCISKDYDIDNHTIVKGRRYTTAQITKVCEMLEQGERNVKIISQETGCKPGIIRDILKKRRWACISEKFNF